MSRLALILAAVGLLALLAWLTLKEPSEPEERGRRPAGTTKREKRPMEIPPVVTPDESGEKPPVGPRAPKEGSLTGTVVDPEGSPLPNAVIVVAIGEGQGRTVGTDEAGLFHLLVRAGVVAVSVRAEGYLEHRSSVNAPADMGTIRLSRGLSIRGRVVTEAGVGVGGLELVTGTTVTYRAKTDEDGYFRFSGMPKEVFSLRIRSIEFRAVGVPPEVTPPGDDVKIVVKPVRLGYGLVVSMDDGAAVPLATVRLTLSRGGWSQSQTDDLGRFAFDLTDATYSDPRLRFTVLVTAEGFEDATVSDQTLDQIRVGAEFTVKLTRAVSVEPGRLRGRVLYDTGAPFVGSLTLSFSREGKAGQIFKLVTNAKGEFLLEKIPPGEYVLRTAPHGETLLRETGKTLVIPPGGEESTQFTLTRGGDVKVTVTGSDGKAVKNAEVSILDENGSEARTFVLPDGVGILNDLPPGERTLRARAPGYEATKTEVTVVKDQSVEASIRMSEDR